jgi:phosphoglycolate phosphatase-like HAD superfamily hydrolase
MTAPTILALDFDGVVCDTVHEGCRSAWQVCREMTGLDGERPSPEAAAAFVRLRPALEHGWEFPVLTLAIADGIPEPDILHGFQAVWRDRLLDKYRLEPKQLAARFDQVRDRTIARSMDDWLADQALYPGMADRLNAAQAKGARLYVITTKEGRFAHRLLEVHGVSLPAERVWGKEARRPKPELLRVLREQEAVAFEEIWFVEDRLKTLQAVIREPDLAGVGLFLALWGYVMPGDASEAAAEARIAPLSLDAFCGEFAGWRK